MTHLFSLAGLFLVLVPVGWGLRMAVPLMGMAIAFIVNGFRVALMAHLVASGQPQAFDYWHDGDGSLIFSMIAVFLFGGLCFLLMRQLEAENTEEEPEEDSEVLVYDDMEWQEEAE